MGVGDEEVAERSRLVAGGGGGNSVRPTLGDEMIAGRAGGACHPTSPHFAHLPLSLPLIDYHTSLLYLTSHPCIIDI